MLIWDIIRDWFVMNIWGGHTSNFDFYSGGIVGQLGNDDLDYYNISTGELLIPFGKTLSSGNDNFYSYISLGDWLSTTSTIIILVAVCVGLYFLTRYFFRMFAGLLSGR